MLSALGHLYVVSSRCEWYLGEIVLQSGFKHGHKKRWSESADFLKQEIFINAINTKLDSDIAEGLRESLRLVEIVRVFRDKMIHGFLGNMNNQEGWIMLKKKDEADGLGEKITKGEINDVVNNGNVGLSGLKGILLGLYHANGEM